MDCSTQFRIRNPSPAAASHFAGERRRPGGRASFRAMSSAAPVEEPAAPEAKQRPSGDSFIRRHLRTLSPYQPILPFEVLSARLGRRPEDIIKLDANENPYGPPPEEDLAKMGVMIRHYDKKELKGYIRISVGKPEHTEALMKGLNALQL
nr:unnamed protein product [Digitaria exilis]